MANVDKTTFTICTKEKKVSFREQAKVLVASLEYDHPNMFRMARVQDKS